MKLICRKIYSTFSRICRTLDAHSILFKIVPSQNTYAAVLSGALSMIVQVRPSHTNSPIFEILIS